MNKGSHDFVGDPPLPELTSLRNTVAISLVEVET